MKFRDKDMQDPEPTQQVLFDLRQARRRVENHWGKGAFGATSSETGAVCAIGGVMYATGQRKWRPWKKERFYNALHFLKHAHWDPKVSSIIRHNDSPWTSHRDVLRHFDIAIGKVERALAARERRYQNLTPIELDDSEFCLIELPKPAPVVEEVDDDREPVGASA